MSHELETTYITNQDGEKISLRELEEKLKEAQKNGKKRSTRTSNKSKIRGVGSPEDERDGSDREISE